MANNLDFIEQQGVGAGFVVKTADEGLVFDGTDFVQITSPNYPSKTVRGVVYLDGTYYVMTPDAAIYGSEINDPSGWSALNVRNALSEPDGGVMLARQANLVVAFGEYSTEFFYTDPSASVVGSPLAEYSNSFLQVGCAAAGSVVNAENTILFMSQARQRGRSIQRMVGTDITPVSNPRIDRILDKANLYGVRAFYIKVEGHSFYMLVLPSEHKTLVMDLTTGKWTVWTVLQSNEEFTILDSEWKTGFLSITSQKHSIKNGDAILYNGEYYPAKVVDDRTISLPLLEEPETLATTFEHFVSEYFDIAGYVKDIDADLILDSTTGLIFALSSDEFQDAGQPIKYKVRTPLFDAGNNKYKSINKVELIGDKEEGVSYLNYTDDDYRTWSNFRTLQMSQNRTIANRLGRTRRRAFNIINFEDTPVRIKALEMSATEGVS